MKKLDEDTLEYLDSISMIVAELQEIEKASEDLGEPPDRSRQALLTLGEAYMYLYGLVLDDQ